MHVFRVTLGHVHNVKLEVFSASLHTSTSFIYTTNTALPQPAMGVSTRRQRGAAKPRAFDEDTITAKPKNKLPKKQPPSPVKTVVQKRRRLLSKAPQ